MEKKLPLYRLVAGDEAVDSLLQEAAPLKRAKLVHVNSTREGGGVAEILHQMVPLIEELGMEVEWLTLQGNESFFECTKRFHNLLQGQNLPLPSPSLINAYEKTNAENAAAMSDRLTHADIVFIHDPQPLPLLEHLPQRKGIWFWRCHLDLSAPSKTTLNYLKKYMELYDASIFSLKNFAPPLPHPVYFVPPSIDPLSEKNIELDQKEIQKIYGLFGIDLKRPTIVQVSRFDRFKDPVGVIQAYRLAKKSFPDLQLILAGGYATDDLEAGAVLMEVKQAAGNDPDIYILLLPPTAHRVINALQRGATIVLQKSLKEGFGLTVSEALWKTKPVIGGNCGGIRLQIIDSQSGFLVNSPEEASRRIEFLLQNPQTAQELGCNGKQRVKDKFLITRHLKDYLTIINRSRSKKN